MIAEVGRIVLAYSGGLASSAAIPWLAEKYDAEVIAITIDMGQGDDLEQVRDRALAIGAVRAHVLDARDELAREFLVRAVRADATAADQQPLVTALGRPLIARKLAEIAAIEQATSVAHGASSPADAARLDAVIRMLTPHATALAPARDWEMSRLQLLEYTRTRRMSRALGFLPSYSVDATLWGRLVAATGAGLRNEPTEELYRLTTASRNCPGEPAHVEIAFDRGTPVAVNGVSMPIIDLIDTVTMIAGSHGVGRFDVSQRRGAGARRRAVCEAPAAVVLHAAHRELQKLAIGKAAARFSRHVSRQYGELVESGLWFSPLREALDAYVDSIQERVTGTIRARLFRGECRIVGRKVVKPKASTTRLRVVAAKTH